MIPSPFQLDAQMPLPTAEAENYARTALSWAQDVPAGIACERNVSYGPSRLHRYDVFHASHADKPPVVIFWHGGGWTNGYKEWGHFMAEHVVRLGATLVLPDYRLAPESRMPAAFDDCALLLRALAASPGFAGNLKQVYVAGHSAGGHLAALTALRLGGRDDAIDGGVTIRGCAPISGIMDLAHPSPPAGSLEARVYDMVLGDADDDSLFSPVCWTAGNAVPFALSYGEHDSERVIRSNRRLASLLACQSAAVVCREARDLNHFETHLALRDPDCDWYAMLDGLMRGNVQ
ncbi:alpha/beta hydrolase [Burkholderia lata]|uniref:Carboxylesterase NlhH n=2 Tax=Burkholderia lata (strain ATCC 17760 / DSM 23089 / LMG 22485 / NCIMB 9086 / R18194 / 383) TaxID=482957 RepID=A0A833PQX7_BURL3|nr:MAG: Carboxylesterase NlhH [Burkholderia lata]VWB25450.1 alpha/beta hydrolase [Burkholderia lata]